MPAPAKLHQFVYVSDATGPLTVEALQLLLRKARAYNHAHHVTGLLFYSDGAGENSAGAFLQILEGPEDVLRGLVSNIRLDTRNVRVRVLADGPVAERLFPEWAMGFVAVVPPDLDRLTDYLRGQWGAASLPRAQTMSPELRQRMQAVLDEYPVWPHFLE
ncbi:BLUF domain-containing protein [Hymenobacter caeli]|uniref:BLUF domain-containing protein n=1 Tax=Hymenobacter caeli TaxID=2735894 RepID=A0ABX2FPI4_9BACT|nr:BLUF domain-containing protein [Hymenobacter caeli]NRT18320.1 hypothetical protein [Hymenobacter caeli]